MEGALKIFFKGIELLGHKMRAFFLKISNGFSQWPLAHRAYNKKGQVIIEYVLLLVVSAAMAMVFIRFINIDCEPPRSSGPNCIFFRYWLQLLQVIGADIST